MLYFQVHISVRIAIHIKDVYLTDQCALTSFSTSVVFSPNMQQENRGNK